MSTEATPPPAEDATPEPHPELAGLTARKEQLEAKLAALKDAKTRQELESKARTVLHLRGVTARLAVISKL